MSKKITKYDIELSNRIEKIGNERGFTKDDMAHFMSVDIGTYKRYAYKISKIPAEAVALLCDALELDLTYVMYGRDRSAHEFLKYLETIDQGKLADLYFEAARECRERSKTEESIREKNKKAEAARKERRTNKTKETE